MLKKIKTWFKKFKCSFNSACCKTQIDCEVDENRNKRPHDNCKTVDYFKDYK